MRKKKYFKTNQEYFTFLDKKKDKIYIIEVSITSRERIRVVYE